MNHYRVVIDHGLVVIDDLHCSPDKIVGGKGLSEGEKKVLSDLQPGQTAEVADGEFKVTRLS